MTKRFAQASLLNLPIFSFHSIIYKDKSKEGIKLKKYGLIGKSLSYSFSKIIHEKLFELYQIDATYELIETDTINRDLLERYDGLNITIPYKTEVMTYLDENNCPFPSCNTIKNEAGVLRGYNTDIAGFDLMIKVLNLPQIERVTILGSGASSKMIQHYFKDIDVTVISRQSNTHNYRTLSRFHGDILINTTPIGMAEYESPVSVQTIEQYESVIDLNYNPLNSKLMHDTMKQNKTFVTGLIMLVEQAIKAFEIWNTIKVDRTVFDKIYAEICFILFPKIAIVGMSLSGKTTLIKKLGGLDLDAEIERRTKTCIPVLLDRGDFRDVETQILTELVSEAAPLIALGGGAALKHENIELLKDYLIIALNTPLEVLKERSKSNYRPLIKNTEDVERLYNERYETYHRVSNLTRSSTDIEYLFNKYHKK